MSQNTMINVVFPKSASLSEKMYNIQLEMTVEEFMNSLETTGRCADSDNIMLLARYHFRVRCVRGCRVLHRLDFVWVFLRPEGV